ncbi:ParA family protein [Billgrantia desiderata]|jgi:chromosome partitioning related protein ParA|uniref:ParA family protein n=1 Tax=Billgrantia desiderata TaxID=52021 RepID=UPI00089ED9C4|nr:ParA family protein [Halomonas desiderata]SEG30848.1 chromosome partitioning related protein ParA [Halomonas desiderata]
MRVISIICSKGGVGKTTTTANLGGLLADAGLHVLLVDLDVQPSLSSYYLLSETASGGIYELIAQSDTRPERIISRTVIDGLDIVLSNDHQGQLQQLLLNAPDGRFRLAHLLSDPMFDCYDVILIDTQGARSVMLESAILAADQCLSPIPPDMLSAREFARGTAGLLDDLETLTRYTTLTVPRLSLMFNRVDETRDGRDIVQQMRELYSDDERIWVMDSQLRMLAAFKQASSAGEPIHRFEPVKPYARKTPAGADLMKAVAKELNPQWAPVIDAMQCPGTEQGDDRHVSH